MLFEWKIFSFVEWRWGKGNYFPPFLLKGFKIFKRISSLWLTIKFCFKLPIEWKLHFLTPKTFSACFTLHKVFILDLYVQKSCSNYGFLYSTQFYFFFIQTKKKLWNAIFNAFFVSAHTKKKLKVLTEFQDFQFFFYVTMNDKFCKA